MKIRDLNRLAAQLAKSGVAPRVSKRLIRELREHYEDSVESALAQGHCAEEADRLADQKLGAIDQITAAVLTDPNLLSWSRRAPLLVYVLGPILFSFVVIAFVFLVLLFTAEVDSSLLAMRPVLDWVLLVVSGWMDIIIATGFWLAARRSYSPVLMPLLGTILILSIGSAFSMGIGWPIGSQTETLVSMSLAYTDHSFTRSLLLSTTAGLAYLALLVRVRAGFPE